MKTVIFDADFAAQAEVMAVAGGHNLDLRGISAGFDGILEEFPLLHGNDIAVRVGCAYGFYEEGPRLICEGSNRSILLRIQPRRFFNHGLLQTFLRHCLLKASDMVDPDFGYFSPIEFGGRTSEEDEKISECFEDLWGELIAARLGYRAHRKIVGEQASVVYFSSEPQDPGTWPAPVTQGELILKARGMVRGEGLNP